MKSALLPALLLLAACSSSSSSTTSADGGASNDGGSTSSSASAGGDGGSRVGDGGVPTDCGDSTAQTQKIVTAANAFLATFTSTDAVKFPFTRPAASSAYNGGSGRLGETYGSAQWSNYPVSDIPRPGIQRGTLTAAQVAAEDTLLQTMLSADGYTKVKQIMGADQTLCDQGQSFSCGTAVYTIGIFGTPSATDPWMIEFGGHHLGLNVVIDGSKGTVAPTLTGAQPATYTAADGSAVRVLAAENDKGFALLASLDATQSAQAISSSTISDLVLGPGHEGATLVPEGLKGSAMTAAQRALLVDLIDQWAGILSTPYVCSHLADIEAGLDDTYFLWSGPTTHADGKNGSSYYRIQGPRVVIEFSPQGVGGDPTNHVHTVYRDPTNDYGHAW